MQHEWQFPRVSEHVKRPKQPRTIEEGESLEEQEGPAPLVAWALIKAANSDDRALAPVLAPPVLGTVNGGQYAYMQIDYMKSLSFIYMYQISAASLWHNNCRLILTYLTCLSGHDSYQTC